MKVNTRNFRTDLDDYVELFLMYQKPTVKCTSPFIVISFQGLAMEVKGIYHIGDLVMELDNSLVFHTWVGEWKSDVFHYNVKEIRDRLQNYGYFAKWV